jgi:hypothetical protein
MNDDQLEKQPKEINGIIYASRNRKNGKYYIGQSTQSLNNRRIKHESDAKNNSPYPFHRALRKYNYEFDWFILAEGITDKKTLTETEDKFMKEYHSMVWENGYNVRDAREHNTWWKSASKEEQNNHIQKIRKLNQIRWENTTDEEKLKRRMLGSQILKEKYKNNEIINKNTPKKEKSDLYIYSIIFNDGRKIETTDFKKYCNENNLKYINILQWLAIYEEKIFENFIIKRTLKEGKKLFDTIFIIYDKDKNKLKECKKLKDLCQEYKLDEYFVIIKRYFQRHKDVNIQIINDYIIERILIEKKIILLTEQQRLESIEIRKEKQKKAVHSFWFNNENRDKINICKYVYSCYKDDIKLEDIFEFRIFCEQNNLKYNTILARFKKTKINSTVYKGWTIIRRLKDDK